MQHLVDFYISSLEYLDDNIYNLYEVLLLVVKFFGLELFAKVELAEEMVETEEELKRELSQEFIRWRKICFHQLILKKVPVSADQPLPAQP